jgi:hypothetical protein
MLKPILQDFPHGLAHLRSQTGWQLAVHNRWWDADTVYARKASFRPLTCPLVVFSPV